MRAAAPIVLLERSADDYREPARLVYYPAGGAGLVPGTVVATHHNGLESVFSPPLGIDAAARACGPEPHALIHEIVRHITARQILVYTCHVGKEWEEALLAGFDVVDGEKTADELALWLSLDVPNPWDEPRGYADLTLLRHADGRLAARSRLRIWTASDWVDIAISVEAGS